LMSQYVGKCQDVTQEKKVRAHQPRSE